MTDKNAPSIYDTFVHADFAREYAASIDRMMNTPNGRKLDLPDAFFKAWHKVEAPKPSSAPMTPEQALEVLAQEANNYRTGEADVAVLILREALKKLSTYERRTHP